MRSFVRLLVLAVFVLCPVAASAHVGIGDTHGLARGFGHPFSGLDHILAMLAVGMLAAHLGGRALWLVPLAFVGVMALAGLAGAAAINVPFVETGIGLSVVVLGLAVALRLNLPTAAAMVLAGFFAIFHGHAHGAEMPATASGLAYGAGFLCATCILHVAGLYIGITTKRLGAAYAAHAARFAGTTMTLAGAAMLVGML